MVHQELQDNIATHFNNKDFHKLLLEKIVKGRKQNFL